MDSGRGKEKEEKKQMTACNYLPFNSHFSFLFVVVLF